jgi:signal peptidase I
MPPPRGAPDTDRGAIAPSLAYPDAPMSDERRATALPGSTDDESTVPIEDRLRGFGAAVSQQDIDRLRGEGKYEPRHARRPKKISPLRNAVEWVIVIAGALALALVIRTFLFAAFYIPSPSMVPTLKENDRVLVNKLSYRLHDVNRGDVIVFERPPAEADQSIKDLIKRVIGLPGETVESREGRVVVDGRYLEEPYLRLEESGCSGTENLPPTVVPDGHVFVMGDNRCDSSDSRVFGAIDQELIVGRAFVRVWPITHLGWL